jgi:phage-related protein
LLFNGIKSLASSIWNGIKSAISIAVSAARSAVSGAFSAMRNTVSSIMSGIKSTITSMWNSAVRFLKGINLYSIGKNIIQGLINGIKGMAGAVYQKAKEIADKVKSTIKKALGIHSPSRVMRDEVGKWIPIGLAEGISRNISTVVSATNRMAQATIPIISTPTIPNIEANTTRLVNTPSVSNVSPAIIQIVTPDRRTIAQWLVDDITEFQEFNLLRKRRFEGR